MNQDEFAAFHTATSAPLWRYVRRLVRSTDLADELTQEAYVRLLTATSERSMTEEHCRHYLFRIATNLVNDHYRSAWRTAEEPEEPSRPAFEETQAVAHDLVEKTLNELRHQDRALLWLAYAEGDSHSEIASKTGYRAASVRPLLHQAKRRALEVLRRLLSQSVSTEKV
jgi:RNA polymerase sigma-70 factor (ECF subfamily)